jgi:RND family efflux transporter MFP subunit
MKWMNFGLAIALSALGLAGCRSDVAPVAAAPQTAAARVVTSVEQQAPVTLHATGTVHARESAVVSAQVMGRIEQVAVHEGDTVRAGETLAVLDGAALRDAAAQAQAGVIAAQNQQAAAESNAALAASTLARYEKLESEKSVSPQEMDEVRRRSEAAAAQLAAARAQTEAARSQASGAGAMLGYTRLVAPYAGVVTARMADPGTMAAPGVPLLQIDRTGALQLQVTVDESMMGAVRLGEKVSVTIDAAGSPLEARVAEIVPAADPASHSFTVKLDLPASRQLRAGMYGSADFAQGTHQAILVPRSAVVERGSLEVAYVLNAQGIAELRYITLGAAHGNQVEVLSGIAPGERLVDMPEDRDLAGKRIEVEP